MGGYLQTESSKLDSPLLRGRGGPWKHTWTRAGYLDLGPVLPCAPPSWPQTLLEASVDPKWLHWLDSALVLRCVVFKQVIYYEVPAIVAFLLMYCLEAYGFLSQSPSMDCGRPLSHMFEQVAHDLHPLAHFPLRFLIIATCLDSFLLRSANGGSRRPSVT